MADNPEAPPIGEEEEGGGPVKTFLEHLEDLRWVLIKSGTAILVGMVVCLLGVNQLVSILKWPLSRAQSLQARSLSSRKVNVYFDTNRVASFYTKTNRIGSIDLGGSRTISVRLEPVSVGERQVLAVNVSTNDLPGETVGKGPNLIFLDPAAPFISSLHLAFFGGLLLAAPLVFYFVGQFVVPALKRKERKYFSRAFGVGVGLFLLGVCFCYFGIMPFALRAAEAYSLWMGVEMPEWRAETYFSFVTKFMLGMGLGFEMPVILLALVKIGLLDYRKLAAMRRYMIIVNLLLGALLTTPEVLTQVLMAVPLQILYECAVWIAWYWEWRDKRQARLQASRQPEEAQGA